jgi:hypothetical protein
MRHLLIIAAILAGTCSVSAAEIDFGKPLIALNGKPYMDCVEVDQSVNPPRCSKTEPLTLGRMVSTVLNVRDPHEQMKLEEIVRRGTLAQKVYAGGKIDLPAEDVALIKAQLAKAAFSPLEVTAAVQILDPVSAKGK